jgi:regulator of sigma E protease
MEILTYILIFIIVLVILILVHEFGHFVVAKLSGMRVDEFGIGFPPRALTIAKKNGTEYTLNWIPFGGFVRIYGEDGDLERSPDSFSAKPRILQALTLVAGIAMNIIFAYLLLTVTLIMGTQQVLRPSEIEKTKDAQIILADVTHGSIAEKAGFKPGDIIKGATTTTSAFAIGYAGTNPAGLSTLIGDNTGEAPMTFLVERNGKEITVNATPKKGVIKGAPDRPGIGFTLAAIGTVKTSPIEAPWQGVQYTWNVTKEISVGLYTFFKGIFTFHADLSQVTGPVGIANAVGQASSNGIAALLTLTAIISINLALINVLPVPALDGGRLLFVVIEAVTRKPIHPNVSGWVNSVGFVLLILLMVVVTAHDIFKLFA